MANRRTGVYPGTFDPVTNGHLDLITRATRVVDHLVVGVAANLEKTPMFNVAEREAMVKAEIEHLNGHNGTTLEVRTFDNLLMHFVTQAGASIIVRGLRAVSDFEFEFQMVGMNARLNADVETIFLMASENNQFIASSLVKVIARLDGDVSSFVPRNIVQKLRDRAAEERSAKSAS
ncbi:MAG: pantetheine-phosphate adenylyltransferase [Alphaproteobacteria bacterium]|nr:pantetheine-phosphate adenylyltransferase [Alphaproteobacteria bacterium]MDP6623434.1 pantetheine-phosphate adenylyltransferase [Alphaproteobacteria bacterium]